MLVYNTPTRACKRAAVVSVEPDKSQMPKDHNFYKWLLSVRVNETFGQPQMNLNPNRIEQKVENNVTLPIIFLLVLGFIF
jgi:hypothetical protein